MHILDINIGNRMFCLMHNFIKQGYNKPLLLFVEKCQFFNQIKKQKQWVNNITYH